MVFGRIGNAGIIENSRKYFWIFALLFPCQVTAENDVIGMYFDVATRVSCSNVFSEPMVAYLVISEMSHPSDFGGWEARLESDPNIVLLGGEIFGDVINVGNFPEYIVGLGSPLPSVNNEAVLGAFPLYAIGEGMVYIKPISSPSIEGATNPIFCRFSSSELAEMEVREISSGGAVCWFAFNCSEALYLENMTLESYSIQDSKSVVVDRGKLYEYAPELTEIGLELAFYNSDISFLGSVVDVRYDCLVMPMGDIQSLAIVEFEVMENFWGARGSRVVLETKVCRPDNCIQYNREYFESFDVGEVFMVAAKVNENRIIALHLLRQESGKFLSPKNIESIGVLNFARSEQSRREIFRQVEASDFVGIVRVVEVNSQAENRGYLVEILKPYTVGMVGDRLEIPFEDNFDLDNGRVFYDPILQEGDEYLVFLRGSENSWNFLAGYYSAFQVKKSQLYGPRGVPWGPIGLAESIIRRAK